MIRETIVIACIVGMIVVWSSISNAKNTVSPELQAIKCEGYMTNYHVARSGAEDMLVSMKALAALLDAMNEQDLDFRQQLEAFKYAEETFYVLTERMKQYLTSYLREGCDVIKEQK